MSTIQDVARQAGVSTSTVSNVLNGRVDRMRSDTLGRVEAAITALRFRPSQSARQLKTGHTAMLGLLVPSIANPMYGAIAREIETLAQERHGYRVMMGNTYRDRDKEAAFFDDLLAHGVRGVVVISSLVDERHFESAGERGLVLVSYDRRATPGTRSGIDHVTVDNFEAARLATAHLIAHGHKRLAFVTAAGLTMSRQEKIKGFLAAAEAAGSKVQTQVIEGTPDTQYGDSVMSELGRAQAQAIAAMPQRPTGLVAVNDMMALGLLSGLRDAGLAVPADISVVGMDGLFLTALAHPRVSTVRLPLPEMARTIVERVMLRLTEPETPTGEFIFQPELLQRESVARPPKAR